MSTAGKVIWGLIMAGFVLLFGFNAFPGLKTVATIDTTGFSNLNVFAAHIAPYALVVCIIYFALRQFNKAKGP